MKPWAPTIRPQSPGLLKEKSRVKDPLLRKQENAWNKRRILHVRKKVPSSSPRMVVCLIKPIISM